MGVVSRHSKWPTTCAGTTGGRELSTNSGRALEDEVGRLFEVAGCRVDVRRTIAGARGNENVDVLVEFDSLGLADFWIVECKDHGSKVKRGDVQLFQKKVENVGASRGIFVARSGYQGGCAAVVDKTNVSLLSVEELGERLGDDITLQHLRALLVRIVSLDERVRDLETFGEQVPGKPFRRGVKRRLPTGPRCDEYFARLGKLAFLKHEVTDAIVGRGSPRMPADVIDEEAPDDFVHTIHVSTRREFCELVENFVVECEAWATELVRPS